MNGNQQLEVHYINTGFPYTNTESFMDFFEGLTHAPVHYAHAGPLLDQETAYWSMNLNSYKFGLSSPGSTTYYGPYEVNDHLPIMDVSRRAWEYPSMVNMEEPADVDLQSGGNAVPSTPNHDDDTSSQVIWQDIVDPDNMTYEELLDLGEAVGTHSRGLSQEFINLLPTSRYKSGRFFLRRKSRESSANNNGTMNSDLIYGLQEVFYFYFFRCVICLMRYKRGDSQINLPCKHIYHTECGTKWLSINKTCPVCNTEVFGSESSHET
ncbi:E3 ubiquitin-protein ligase BIG BROTHER isoform X2 [Cornus florida]|uniref:E3 ubiquitin-protein ligase BIG BROTHER isoform X2 n=1 Tax=Cornus florida TaxID=4283 RepID=UPI00289E7B03|nr:E3 ubiquitin-protein ligase BIG BROTHER isoform X2 [Cornus florida]